MKAKTLAFLGTGSNVGKSIITAGLCRVLANRGKCVAPFKAQNMSNNSWVTVEGGEIGRAQVVQAQASYIEPHVDMNPVLLKPSSKQGSQIIVHGTVWRDTSAEEYTGEITDYCAAKAFQSLKRLMNTYEYVIIEGAGSCAELNLLSRDFVNFRTALQAKAPVILVTDIDTGGVFAKVVGTLAVLPKMERQSVKGILINKFHGYTSFFESGKELLEQKTGLPVVGIIPFLSDISFDAEDSVPLSHLLDPKEKPTPENISIAVIALPSISNWTDFHVLQRIPQVEVHFLSHPKSLDRYDCLLLPGAKGVLSDLAWLNHSGWQQKIKEYSGKLFGICGGYQMLGRNIADPYGTEGTADEASGLGYLNMETIFSTDKILTRVSGHCRVFDCSYSGYEIHMGRTTIHEDTILLEARAALSGESYGEGCVSRDRRVMGTYAHGILDHSDFLYNFLRWINTEKADRIEYADVSVQSTDDVLDKLAEHLEQCVAVDTILDCMNT